MRIRLERSAPAMALESDLYAPIKAFLEGQGYDVKGEVKGCDVVARRGREAPVVVELKQRFSLDLVLQGIERQKLSDKVYLAVLDAPGATSTLRRRGRAVTRLCRMLGLGLLVVRPDLKGAAAVEPRLDPGPYKPRQIKPKRERLLREFARRVGDPNRGGSTRRTIMTAYRQDALRCADHLGAEGPAKPARVREATGVARAGRILQRDVYGWFERPERGLYRLSPLGEAALEEFAEALTALRQSAHRAGFSEAES